MKNELNKIMAVTLLLVLSQGAAYASLTATNRLSVSARVGFNIDAGFTHSYGAAGGPVRTTPDGDPYNYDDGYVYPDSAGNADTWYWGYDNAGQISGSEILMNRTVSSSASGMNDMEGSTPTVGAELTYSHMLEIDEKHRFGFDFSIGFIPLDFEEHGQVTDMDVTTTDHYALLGDPALVPGAPYQGTFGGGGYLISSAPNSSSVSTAPGQTYDVDSELQGFLWSTRIGPFVEFPLSEALTLHMALGLSLGILDVDADWNAYGTTPARGGGSDTELLSGGFIGADLFWEIEDDWHIATGLEFEYLNDWEKEFGNGMYTLDFTRMYYLTVGLMHEF